jgi:UDP:flavonoid glycosyltransferase YjiC (YdhE family)
VSRVLLTAGTGSHALPLLPFVAALKHEHEVTFVVPPAVVPYVSGAGVEVIVGDAPDAAVAAEAWARFQSAAADEASVIANREIFGRLNTRALLPAVERACRDRQPTLVLHEAAEFAGPIAALRAGIAHAQVAISRARPEHGSLELARPELEAVEPGSAADIAGSPYLTRFPAVLDPSPYARTLRYRETSPPTAESEGTSVYVTFGTVAPSLSGELPHRRAIDAVLAATEDDVEIVITTGQPTDLGPMPDRVRVESWLDQDVVLGSAAAVVCHGGSGTVMAALRHGIPLVVVPMFADQHGNGREIAAAGAGLVLTRRGTASDLVSLHDDDTAALTTALRRVLVEPAFRASAQQVAAEIARTDPIDQLLAELING